jgi:hypothetical protein
MKKSLAFLAFILSINMVSFGQWTTDSIIHPADSIHDAYRERMAEMFEHVDLSEVPSGILYDRGFPFIILDPFRGELNDSSKSAQLNFSMAYASIASMAVSSTSILPHPAIYRECLDSVDENSPIIPVMGLHQVYKVDSNAFGNNQMEIIDNNLHDIFPRTGSPSMGVKFIA